MASYRVGVAWPDLTNTGPIAIGITSFTTWPYSYALGSGEYGNFPTDANGYHLVENYNIAATDIRIIAGSSKWRFRACKFLNGGSWDVFIEAASDIIFEYCEFGSPSAKLTQPAQTAGVQYCIINNGSQVRIKFCQFYHWANAIEWRSGTVLSIHDSYFFNSRDSGSGIDHTDCYLSDGSDGLTINHCWLESYGGGGPTAVIALYNGTTPFSINHSNVTITNNFLAGGSYALYGGSAIDVGGTGHVINGTYTGNRFSTKFFTNCGINGPVAGHPVSLGISVTWANNKFTNATATVDGADIP